MDPIPWRMDSEAGCLTQRSKRVPFCLPLVFFILGFCAACASDNARKELERRGVQANTAALEEAAESGDSELLELFFRADFSPNHKDTNGFPLLGKAIISKKPNALQTLLKHKADVSAPLLSDGMTPLMLAVKNNQPKMVKLLVEAGAPVNVQDEHGNTALLHAVDKRQEELVSFLLRRGADPNLAAKNAGASALLMAARDGDTELVRLLVQAKAGLDQPEKSFQMTPLAIAAFKGHGAVVTFLLEAGADVQRIDKNGLTPLMAAAFHGQTDAVEAFVSHGVDLNQRNAEGLTPLMMAAIQGHEEIVRKLTAAGADSTIAADDGFTALIGAEREGHREITDILRREAVPKKGGLLASSLKPALPKDWLAYDPFTEKTPYWLDLGLLPSTRDPEGTKRAYFQSPVELQQQFFVVQSSASFWLPKIGKKILEMDAHPLVTHSKAAEKLAAHDGTSVTYHLFQMEEGVLAGRAVTYLLAIVQEQEHLLLFDYGGLTKNFDEALLMRMLQEFPFKQVLHLPVKGRDYSSNDQRG